MYYLSTKRTIFCISTFLGSCAGLQYQSNKMLSRVEKYEMARWTNEVCDKIGKSQSSAENQQMLEEIYEKIGLSDVELLEEGIEECKTVEDTLMLMEMINLTKGRGEEGVYEEYKKGRSDMMKELFSEIEKTTALEDEIIEDEARIQLKKCILHSKETISKDYGYDGDCELDASYISSKFAPKSRIKQESKEEIKQLTNIFSKHLDLSNKQPTGFDILGKSLEKYRKNPKEFSLNSLKDDIKQIKQDRHEAASKELKMLQETKRSFVERRKEKVKKDLGAATQEADDLYGKAKKNAHRNSFRVYNRTLTWDNDKIGAKIIVTVHNTGNIKTEVIAERNPAGRPWDDCYFSLDTLAFENKYGDTIYTLGIYTGKRYLAPYSPLSLTFHNTIAESLACEITRLGCISAWEQSSDDCRIQ